MSMFQQRRGYGYGRYGQNWYQPPGTFNPRGAAQQITGAVLGAGGAMIKEYYMPGQSQNMRYTTPQKRPFPHDNDITTEKEKSTKQKLRGKRMRQPDFSDPNLPATTTMAPGVANTGELPVIPPPKKVAKTAPDYFTVNLPYETVLENFFVEEPLAAGHTIQKISLNSIYNPLVLAYNIGDTEHVPQGRNTWTQIYKYYRVLECKVRIHLVNVGYRNDQVTTDTSYNFFGWETTDELTDVSGSATAFLESKNCRAELVPGYKENPLNRTTFEYFYTPGGWDDHVQEASPETMWTPINESPASKHYLLFRTFPGYGTNTTNDIQCKYTISLSYKVQFREAKFGVIRTTDTITIA